MVTLADILDLSPIDEEAFVQFEALCRRRLDEALYRLSENEPEWPHHLEYMSRVAEAASEYGVDPHDSLAPSTDQFRPADLDRFRQNVFRLVTRAQIRSGRRAAKDTLELEPSDRTKLAFQIKRLRDQVDAAVDLDSDRKKALHKKLDELLGELEQSKVNLARLMVILAATATLITQSQSFVIRGPEMLVSIMDTISIVAGKEEQRRLLLEHYRQPKALEDKSDKTAARETFSEDLDDEIPF